MLKIEQSTSNRFQANKRKASTNASKKSAEKKTPDTSDEEEDDGYDGDDEEMPESPYAGKVYKLEAKGGGKKLKTIIGMRINEEEDFTALVRYEVGIVALDRCYHHYFRTTPSSSSRRRSSSSTRRR